MFRRYSVTAGGSARLVELEEMDGGQVRVAIDGRERILVVSGAAPAGAGPFSSAVTWLDGTRVVHALVDGGPAKAVVALRGVSVPIEVADARAPAAGAGRVRPVAAGPLTVRAPIPGRIAKLLVKAGDQVTAGKPLMVLEAMKMENEIRAPRDGVVRELRCAEGATVDANQDLIVLD